jgi:hypothetical protein
MARTIKKETEVQEQELPIIKSVAVHQVGSLWTCLTIYTRGDKVITVENTEPTSYNSAINDAKIKFVEAFRYS